MPGAGRLGGQIAPIVRVDRSMQRHASRYFDAGLGKPVELGRIVGEEPHPRTAQHSQHAHCDAVVAFVIVKSKHRIRIECIETSVLELIGAHFIGEAESPAFLLQIKNDAPAMLLEFGKCQAQLIAAVAPS